MRIDYRTLLQEQVRGKKILVFGLGKQGGGTTVARILSGCGAVVRVSDQKSAYELELSPEDLPPEIELSLGEHRSDDIDWAEMIIKNPGVPFSHPLMQQAEQKGIPVLTETALALPLIRENTIGITGTRGKTTTTHLIHHILTFAGKEAHIGGNIPGKPTLSLLTSVEESALFVLEIPSFHIESLMKEKISPHVAVVTNVYPDHLDRYSSLEAYAATKAALFSWQKDGDLAFWNGPSEWLSLMNQNIQTGVTFHSLPNQEAGKKEYRLQIPGEHNQDNARVAAAVCLEIGVEDKVIQEALATFTGVPHRLQTAATINGIRWINDSSSTTPIALQKAIESQTEPFILIAGGTTKHLPFPDALVQQIGQIRANIVWLEGSGTSELLTEIQQIDPTYTPFTTRSLPDAMREAKKRAQTSNINTVLFSPGFTSFELFDNEFHRGDTFLNEVASYAEKT